MGCCCTVNERQPLIDDPPASFIDPDDAPEDFLWKILILGDKSIGKTSLIEGYVSKTFSEKGPAFLTTEFREKDLLIRDIKIRLMIYDPLVPSHAFYRGAHAVIFAYDCSNPDTLAEIYRKIDAVHKYNSLEPLPKAIVGLRRDLGDRVSDDDIKNLLQKTGIIPTRDWIFCKLSTKENLEEVHQFFQRVTEDIADDRNLYNQN